MCVVDGCQNEVQARGWCAKHYWRFRQHGSVEGGAPLAERFWSHVDVDDETGCWLWRGGANQNGYGQITVNYKKWTASRYAWLLDSGEDPGEAFVCHTCDTPLCVNPAHLFLGDAQTNSLDAMKKGRLRSGTQRLTPRDVQRIRQLRDKGWGFAEIGEQYGITRGHAKDIYWRRRWKNVP
jgi:hypothetical protein